MNIDTFIALIAVLAILSHLIHKALFTKEVIR